MSRISIARTMRNRITSESLSPFGYLGFLQPLPQLSLSLGWPSRAHAREPGAAAATRRLGGAPAADWVP
jgi:hypothetical protein